MIHTDCGLGYLRLSNEENEVHGLFTANICVLEEMKCDLGTWCESGRLHGKYATSVAIFVSLRHGGGRDTPIQSSLIQSSPVQSNPGTQPRPI